MFEGIEDKGGCSLARFFLAVEYLFHVSDIVGIGTLDNAAVQRREALILLAGKIGPC